MELSEGLNDLTSHMKDILKGLRQLKKSCILAFDMLKVFSEGNNSSIVSLLYFCMCYSRKRKCSNIIFCSCLEAGLVES